jgi:O-glycosyl hydrolase
MRHYTTSLALFGSIVSAQVTINTNQQLQEIHGFGVSQAFGRAAELRDLISAQLSAQALDFMFNRTTGAGLSIIRNRIGSGESADNMILTNPGGPNAKPNYKWDGNDQGQVWFSHQAMKYGVETIYADAWSAPGFMKTNGNQANGGYLCGTPGHSCASGDWRKAYADFLVQYIKFNAQEGIPVTHVGFLNEPDLT